MTMANICTLSVIMLFVCGGDECLKDFLQMNINVFWSTFVSKLFTLVDIYSNIIKYIIVFFRG